MMIYGHAVQRNGYNACGRLGECPQICSVFEAMGKHFVHG